MTLPDAATTLQRQFGPATGETLDPYSWPEPDSGGTDLTRLGNGGWMGCILRLVLQRLTFAASSCQQTREFLWSSHSAWYGIASLRHVVQAAPATHKTTVPSI